MLENDIAMVFDARIPGFYRTWNRGRPNFREDMLVRVGAEVLVLLNAINIPLEVSRLIDILLDIPKSCLLVVSLNRHDQKHIEFLKRGVYSKLGLEIDIKQNKEYCVFVVKQNKKLKTKEPRWLAYSFGLKNYEREYELP